MCGAGGSENSKHGTWGKGPAVWHVEPPRVTELFSSTGSNCLGVLPKLYRSLQAGACFTDCRLRGIARGSAHPELSCAPVGGPCAPGPGPPLQPVFSLLAGQTTFPRAGLESGVIKQEVQGQRAPPRSAPHKCGRGRFWCVAFTGLSFRVPAPAPLRPGALDCARALPSDF